MAKMMTTRVGSRHVASGTLPASCRGIIPSTSCSMTFSRTGSSPRTTRAAPSQRSFAARWCWEVETRAAVDATRKPRRRRRTGRSGALGRPSRSRYWKWRIRCPALSTSLLTPMSSGVSGRACPCGFRGRAKMHPKEEKIRRATATVKSPERERERQRELREQKRRKVGLSRCR